MEKKSLSEYLCGERIYIKKHDVSLAPTMYKYVNEDRERINAFLPWAEKIKTVNDEIEYINLTHKRWNDFTYFDYGIFLQGQDLYLGNIGVHSIKWNHNCAELAYWILGKFEGKGYISEAVGIIEMHLFDLGFNRVQIRCSDLNERSAGVPERCGYTYEGTAREDAVVNGKYRNTKIYSKILSDLK